MEVDPNALVNRTELNLLVESIRREMSGYAMGQTEMNTKLDTLLANKTDDAREMGKLQQQVSRLVDDVRIQGTRIDAISAQAQHAIQDPKDKMLVFCYDLLKLLLAAGLGYLAHRGIH